MRRSLAMAVAALVSSFAFAEPSERGSSGAQGGAIQRAPLPGNFQFTPPPGVTSVQINKQSTDNGMTTTVEEDDREITINDNDDGIKVTIKEPNAEPREFNAKDAATLEKEAPEAYELYQRYTLPCDKGGGLLIPGDRMHAPIEFPMHGGKIESLEISTEFMPNPALSAQLGPGVVVRHVRKAGRGAKLGLKELDYIRTVNGQPVATADQLQEALKDADKLTIEVLRAGEKVLLQE